ncbi:hypothetical protein FOXYSP1_06119 [Fusarium oxysporum f. sp. phaseoli]
MAVYKRTPRECVGSCPVLGHFVDGCLEELGQMSLNRHCGAGSCSSIFAVHEFEHYFNKQQAQPLFVPRHPK